MKSSIFKLDRKDKFSYQKIEEESREKFSLEGTSRGPF